MKVIKAFPFFRAEVKDDKGDAVTEEIYDPGMDMRDFFASEATEDDIAQWMKPYNVDRGMIQPTREQARYRYADAMMKARGKPED